VLGKTERTIILQSNSKSGIPMATIYLSSTSKDLDRHRAAVITALRQLGHELILVEEIGARPESFVQTFRELVSKSDIFVGLVAWRYGYVPDDPANSGRKSFIELEYDEAARAQVPRLMFLLDAKASWPAGLLDSQIGEGEKGARIAQFRERIQRDVIVSYFDKPETLAGLVAAAVSNLVSRGTEAGGNARGASTVGAGQNVDVKTLGGAAKRLKVYTSLQDLANQARLRLQALEMELSLDKGPPTEVSRSFFLRLEKMFRKFRSLVAELPDSGSELHWIERIFEERARLRNAVGEADLATTRKALQNLRQLIEAAATNISHELSIIGRQLIEAVRSDPTGQQPKPVDPQTAREFTEFVSSSERLAKLLVGIALRLPAHSDLVTLPGVDGFREALKAASATDPRALLTLETEVERSHPSFKPNPLWLAWVQSARLVQLNSIRDELKSWLPAPPPPADAPARAVPAKTAAPTRKSARPPKAALKTPRRKMKE
jgi:hypothetical protein